MNSYDVYGIGNALVDTEYEVDDAFLVQAKLPKGIMTLIEEEDRQRPETWKRVAIATHPSRCSNTRTGCEPGNGPRPWR